MLGIEARAGRLEFLKPSAIPQIAVLKHLSHTLNSLEGAIQGIIIGVLKGDTRSEDKSLHVFCFNVPSRGRPKSWRTTSQKAKTTSNGAYYRTNSEELGARDQEYLVRCLIGAVGF